jgi:nitrogen regulatory protein P-II 1
VILWVEESRADEVIRKVVEVARTGRMGDGKIFVLSAQSYERVIGGGAGR